MHWRPPEEHRARRQFELLNSAPSRQSGLGRPATGSSSQFRQPLALRTNPSTGGYHLRFDGEGLASAQPVPAKKRRLHPQDVDDSFAQTEFEASAGYNVGVECLGDPRDYIDETGDTSEDRSGKRSHPAHNTVRDLYSFGWLHILMYEQEDRMASFLALREPFIAESLRLHGLGYSTYDRKCSTCHTKLVTNSEAHSLHVDAIPLYRCRRCGQFAECASCCIRRHQQSPLHRIEVCILTPLGLYF